MPDSQLARWRVLPAFMVRPSGFSFSRLVPLRFSRSVAAAHELTAAERARHAAGGALDDALGEDRTREHVPADDRAARRPLVRHIRRARAFARGEHAGVPDEALAEVVRILPAAAPLVSALGTAHARFVAASEAYAAVFARELDARRAALRATYADDERLREAVFLESPDAFIGVQQLVAADGPRDTKARQRERLAAMYLQRFCAKNDTHSICGPHAIAWLAPHPTVPRIAIEASGERRRSYFSHWAAERLFEQACRRAGEADTVPLRVNPTARITGDTVAWCAIEHDATTAFRRRYGRATLPAAGIAVLAALAQRPCTAAELTRLVAGRPCAPEPGELAALLEEMCRAGLLLARPALPPGLFRPLDALLAEVERWPSGEPRRWAQDRARGLQQLLDEFAVARLPERRTLYRQLVDGYREATGDPAERGQGRHYADRTLVHEDCHAAVRAELGPETVQPLLTALVPLVHAASLPLELARETVRQWFRQQFGEGRRVPVLEVHRAFDEQRAPERVTSTPAAEALRAGIERVRACFDAAVTAAGDGPARVSSAALAAALDGTPCSRPGYVSLDLMFRARPEASSALPELVLGEVHGFFCLPTWGLDVVAEPDRDEVLAALRHALRALAGGRPTVECLFAHTQATDRRAPLGDADLWLIDRGDRDAVRLGQLDLVLDGDELRFLDGHREVVPITAYTTYPFLLYTSRLAPLIDDFAGRFFPEALLPDRVRTADSPRMLVDDVTFRRRTWRRTAGELSAALGAARDGMLLLRAQELRAGLLCPAVVFVSLPGEPKPVLVDFDNFFLVEAFAHLLARQPAGEVVRITEMSPGPDELLARAPDGTRTSELRMGFYRLGT